LAALAEKAVGDVAGLPFSIKILLENLLRHEDGRLVAAADVEAMARWKPAGAEREVAFMPARVLLQDFTGVPAVVDLAAMRDAVKRFDGDPKQINPQIPVELVIDHSVQVDNFGSGSAFRNTVAREYERNEERYSFLRWGQESFENFRVVPPGTGICHQVNLEYLAQVVVRRGTGAEALAMRCLPSRVDAAASCRAHRVARPRAPAASGSDWRPEAYLGCVACLRAVDRRTG
jgi:aconitate hydratase